ncbi:hypothetical protein JB92DRAFT_3102133 [Gautieria morchelliformis]|nr:hypothetical protein JB92DRAFT_3102133 [Gautieria morchelliformis]
MCGFCKSYEDGISGHVQQAVSNTPNPCDKAAGLLQYASPVVATSQKWEQALSVLNDLNSSYCDAFQQNHGDTQLIQKNKVMGSIACQLTRKQWRQSIQIWECQLEHFTVHTANKDEKFSMGWVTNLFAISALWFEVVAFFAVAICKLPNSNLINHKTVKKHTQAQLGNDMLSGCFGTLQDFGVRANALVYQNVSYTKLQEY